MPDPGAQPGVENPEVPQIPESAEDGVGSDEELTGGGDGLLEPPSPYTKVDPPRLETAGAEVCAIEKTGVIATHRGRLRSLAADFGPAGGLVVWEGDAGHIETIAVDRNGDPSGEVRRVEIENGHRVSSVHAVGHRFLVHTSEWCSTKRRLTGQWCVRMRALDSSGAPIGKVLEEQFQSGEPMAYCSVVREPTSLLVLRCRSSSSHQAAKLYRYRIGDDGAIVSDLVHDDGRSPGPSGHLLGYRLAVDGQRWAIYHFHSLTTHAGKIALPSFGEVRFIALGWDGDQFAGIFEPDSGFSGEVTLRPRYIRFLPNGELADRPQILRPGAAVPAPFSEEIRAEVGIGAPVTLTRKNAAGDPIGRDLEVAAPRKGPRDDPPRLVVWNGERFVVVHGDHQGDAWNIVLGQVRCSD